MPTVILIAVITIVAALVFYSIAVWWNWLNKRLQAKHLVFFYLGVFCDALATALMRSTIPEMTYDMHTIVGLTALALMVIVTLIGTYAVYSKNESVLTSFHKFGLPIWFFWTVSWITGVVVGLQ